MGKIRDVRCLPFTRSHHHSSEIHCRFGAQIAEQKRNRRKEERKAMRLGKR